MKHAHGRRWRLGLLASSLVAAALFAWQRQGGTGTGPAAGRPAAPPRAIAPARAPAQAPAQGDVHIADEPPLTVQLERLLATRDPQDAYRAYRLVAACAAFDAGGERPVVERERRARPVTAALPGIRTMDGDENPGGDRRQDAMRRRMQLCGTMTERERQARLDYLAFAARAGVAGAALAFAREGPFGDPSALQSRPDDPLVREWKATARAQLAQAADSGTDGAALGEWADVNFSGSALGERNPALAYRYMSAQGLIYADQLGPDDLLAKVYASDSGMMSELAAAQAIAERARAGRAHAGAQPGPRD